MKGRVFWTALFLVCLAGIINVIVQPGKPDEGVAIATANSTTPPPITDAPAAPSQAATPPATPPTDATPEPSDDVIPDNPDYPTIEARLTEMQARRDGKPFSKEAVRKALASTMAPLCSSGDAIAVKISSGKLNVREMAVTASLRATVAWFWMSAVCPRTMALSCTSGTG